MIFYSIPWDSTKNIGKYYNQFMEILPSENDFACFIDGDAMMLNTYFGKQLETYIEKYPECGIFTCMANRIGCEWQRAGNWYSNDIQEHRMIAETLNKGNYEIEDVTDKPERKVMGGVMILIKKATWQKIGKFKDQGMLGIDNDIHWKAQKTGEKLYLMKEVYVFHWYRGGNQLDKQHLK